MVIVKTELKIQCNLSCIYPKYPIVLHNTFWDTQTKLLNLQNLVLENDEKEK